MIQTSFGGVVDFVHIVDSGYVRPTEKNHRFPHKTPHSYVRRPFDIIAVPFVKSPTVTIFTPSNAGKPTWPLPALT